MKYKVGDIVLIRVYTNFYGDRLYYARVIELIPDTDQIKCEVICFDDGIPLEDNKPVWYYYELEVTPVKQAVENRLLELEEQKQRLLKLLEI